MPVARYGPPDDPNNPDNQPTAYINYGDAGPPSVEPVPWYRKPVALVAFGALGAVLVALIIFGMVKLLTGGSSPSALRRSFSVCSETTRSTAAWSPRASSSVSDPLSFIGESRAS